MRRIVGESLDSLRPHFEQAAAVAQKATCLRAKCGSVIVKNGVVLGEGNNGPPLGDESRRTCNTSWDYDKKPMFDKTCCVHAEWRAIIDACKKRGDEVEGATLFFMRVDENGDFTDAGEPYCTGCSRLTMESGVSDIALWNQEGADVYSTAEYDTQSYNFYALK